MGTHLFLLLISSARALFATMREMCRTLHQPREWGGGQINHLDKKHFCCAVINIKFRANLNCCTPSPLAQKF